MKKHIDAKVTLVGAGPGDPDLMTIAGVKALQDATVILYDALVNKEIMKHAPQAKKIFVGKRLGYKRYKQEEINYLLLVNAMEYGKVVRLKGGDSFIFGRGAEEVDYLQAFGIETKVIPGISSSTSASTAVGISLTERSLAQGFWVITGTKLYGEFTKDIHLAAQSNSTIVILMGMSKLAHITAAFAEEGKEDLPIAIIQNAHCKNQKHVMGTISTIHKKVIQHKIKNPAVIVIGEVVRNSKNWQDLVLTQIANPIKNKES
jgi:uroporphyrin-III C-methyltransferase